MAQSEAEVTRLLSEWRAGYTTTSEYAGADGKWVTTATSKASRAK